ncbi:MAG: hypothetical protein ABW154_11395 [Dyella sp.]
MSIPARSIHYRGYDIAAAGQSCTLYLAGAIVEHFAHDYDFLDISHDLVLALLIGEAYERVDQHISERRYA